MSTRCRQGFDLNNCFFVTTTFRDWKHLFLDDEFFSIVADSLNYCCDKYHADVISYVFMPSHIHIILLFNERSACSDLMRDFKKYTSVRIRTLIDEKGNAELLQQLRYEKNRQKFKVWTTRFDAVAVRHKLVLETKLRYIHANPVKAGIVNEETDYVWSSASWYSGVGRGRVNLRHAGTVA